MNPTEQSPKDQHPLKATRLDLVGENYTEHSACVSSLLKGITLGIQIAQCRQDFQASGLNVGSEGILGRYIKLIWGRIIKSQMDQFMENEMEPKA